MTGIVSVNLKKIKATVSVNALISENYRDDKDAEHYDNGRRMIDTSKTETNVSLLDRPDDYDQHRKDRIERVNRQRANCKGLRLKRETEKLRESGELKAKRNKDISKTRALRSDTVDTIGIVVQPSAEFINAMSREQQVKFFSDALKTMQARPDWYGRIETAVIHFDENTPHMQCLASAINEETLTADAKAIFGNKTRMSKRQTVFADDLVARGWDVTRGLRRVDNPDYRNFKDEMDKLGVKVNRHNDDVLYKHWLELNGVLDERDKDLKRREQAVNQIARQQSGIPERIKALDQAEAQVQSKIKELAINTEHTRQDKAKTERLLKDVVAKKGDLDAREQALDAREQALSRQARDMSMKGEKWLKTQNTALGTIDDLNSLVMKGMRMTEARRREIHKVLAENYPVTPDNVQEVAANIRDLLENGQDLADAVRQHEAIPGVSL